MCPQETFVILAAQRQVSESSGRPEWGLTEKSSAIAAIQWLHRGGPLWAGYLPVIAKDGRQLPHSANAYSVLRSDIFLQSSRSVQPSFCELESSEAAIGDLTLPSSETVALFSMAESNFCRLSHG
jgi:hypothetical protein